jgi:hypothetical protein
VLAALVSREDAALFPTGWVSHNAALALKCLCRQARKPLIPLRSSEARERAQSLRASFGRLQVGASPQV